jgi:DNA-binding GntR family transcriptional regulator
MLGVVRFARATPGARLTKRAFGQLGRVTEAELEGVLPELLATGLVAVEGDMIAVRPLDPDAMFATLPRRREIEIAIARAAAEKASVEDLKGLQSSQMLQNRCAMVGDLDGLIQAESVLERQLINASGLHAEGEELREIKQEFRRAWCARNRLRDFTDAAKIRDELVQAIARRDPDAAERQIQVFFDHILSNY